ncbi:MAG: hypothetical protein EOP05_13275 [Proteobacteria bacterium]|nr:MAG: hypothetical protein EOP05_13275 [Pseudomonadota bacterium]
MKSILVAIAVLLAGPLAQAGFCNWGFVGPKAFKCRGEDYVYGTAACSDGMYSKIFCRTSKMNDGKECADDNAENTLACARELIGIPTPTANPTEPAPKPAPRPKERPYCSEGIMPGRTAVCNGKSYYIASAVCDEEGRHRNVFCESSYSHSVRACLDDNSEETIRCQAILTNTVPPTSMERGRSGTTSTAPTRGSK